MTDQDTKVQLIEKYLCCPICKSGLRASENTITCINCNEVFTYKNGIPVLIDGNSIDAHMKGQIDYFEKEDITATTDYKVDPWQASYLRRFRDTFGNDNYGTIVDSGTGSGYMAVELATNADIVIATDLTLKSLVRLKEIIKDKDLDKKILLVCCDTQCLPIKNDSADFYISNAVFEHLPHELDAISEMNRVTKNGGGAMLVMPINMKYINPLFYLLNWFHDKRIGHLRRYTAQDFITRYAPFKTIKFYYTGHTAKIFKTVFNIIRPNTFAEQEIENQDRKKESQKWWASNICAVMRKPIQ